MITRRQTSIKVDPVAWDAAKDIFKEYNMSVSDGINIFLNKVKLTKGLPFDIKVPSEELQGAIGELKNGEVSRIEANSKKEVLDLLMKDLKS